MGTNYEYNARLNHRVTPEIKYMHIMEAIEEAQHMILQSRHKGETLMGDGIGRSKLEN